MHRTIESRPTSPLRRGAGAGARPQQRVVSAPPLSGRYLPRFPRKLLFTKHEERVNVLPDAKKGVKKDVW